MNSITYLDSLLSRSLQGSPKHSRRPSSSGSGAGDRNIASEGLGESSERRRSRRTASSGTAAAASSVDDKERTELLQEALGSQSGKVTRRASDYSLRRGEKERRTAALALGLGLTPARPNERAAPDQGASSPLIATASVAGTAAANHPSLAVGSEKAREASSRNARQSASEGAYSRRSLDDGGRPALPRRSFRPAGPTRWATLWGLPISGWLTSASRGAEEGRRPSRSADRRSDEEGKDDLDSQRGLARRASSGSLHLGRWRAELEMEAELRADAFAGLGLSEAEAEDVVDFEGGEPESDDDAPTAPPVTPAAGALSPSSSYQLQRSRRVSSQSSAGQGPRREGSESARLASFLFGALASRVDDYFGPQPSQPLARQSPSVTPSGAPTSSPPRVRRVKHDASVSNLVPVPPSFEPSAASRELNSEVKEATANGQPPGPDEPALVDTNALTEAGSPDDPKVLPIPSYSEAEKAAHMNGSSRLTRPDLFAAPAPTIIPSAAHLPKNMADNDFRRCLPSPPSP
ncbi:hypothetical protein CBOM_05315 [Ceraceosorus bombacis]|uniref:Uncharacterized protein n=1 Tax=Ceraceosorus bombacis TaxID=401625 RepID=A0A0P1BRQ3_9BASI|nr:hypothetical protein CBOM_05315 [Ceraceosorus bombacis]